MLSLRDIHRRAIIAPLFAGLVAQAAFGAEGPSSPADLRAEYLTNPMGVDVPQPRFAWTLTHSGRAEVQTAYQILFATSEALLRSDRGDQWDSGKVASDDSTQVVYSGKPLESGHPYFWKVRWWDKEGRASDYSAPATFDTGFFHREDWKAAQTPGDVVDENVLNAEQRRGPENRVRESGLDQRPLEPRLAREVGQR